VSTRNFLYVVAFCAALVLTLKCGPKAPFFCDAAFGRVAAALLMR